MSFPTKYPSIELELVDGTSSRLEEALVRGVIDAAFLVPSVLCRRRAIFAKESARQESMRKSVRLMCEATPEDQFQSTRP